MEGGKGASASGVDAVLLWIDLRRAVTKKGVLCAAGHAICFHSPTHPSPFRCRDPVVAKDGHTYERSAITTWLETHKTSPMVRAYLPEGPSCMCTCVWLAHKAFDPTPKLTP